ncbi:MAG: SRPBCC family protein [Cyanobacteria bacterium]|nr:SRPBCC family protein [Cyanobacteriota bacterium]
MRWILWTIVALVGVVGIIALAGFFLPVRHEASRSAEFNKPPDAVFALIADPDTYQGWWDGAEVKTEVVERVPPTKLVTRIVGETQSGGTWTFDIAPTPNGSRMTITERGEIDNVVFRTLAKYVFGYTSTMEASLAAAQKRLA